MLLRKTAGLGLRAFVLVGLVLHFAATLLHVLPANPLKLRYGHLATMTIGTYFPQNWSLFAPAPVQRTQSLLVRCLAEDELPKSSTEKLPAGDWQDVSLAHFEQAHRHPISVYERLVRPIQNAIRRYLYGGPDLNPWLEACNKGDQEACKFRDENLKPRQASALQMLRGIGSAFCRENFPSRHFAGVALRLRERDAIPWSERGTGSPKVTDYQIGVLPLQHDVALPRLYEPEPSR